MVFSICNLLNTGEYETIKLKAEVRVSVALSAAEARSHFTWADVASR